MSLPAGGVVAGFFSFTEITDGAHRAYNEWHQLDHLPEQLPIRGISFGQRWVSSPRCAAVTRSSVLAAGGLDFASTHYVTLYLMQAPLEETIRDFYDLAARLHVEDRFFSQRRAIASGPLELLAAVVAPRVRLTAAALPYRPNRGAYIVVEDSGAPMDELLDMAGSPGSPGSPGVAGIPGVAGVAGVWAFAGDSAAESKVSRARGKNLSGQVAVCFLDEDPLEVAPEIEKVLQPSWEKRGIEPRFAGPLETITPWSWDWFE